MLLSGVAWPRQASFLHSPLCRNLPPQVAQERFDNQCVVVRVLDPARAEFYRKRGLRTVCPTSVAIDVLLDSVRACEVRPREPAAS